MAELRVKPGQFLILELRDVPNLDALMALYHELCTRPEVKSVTDLAIMSREHLEERILMHQDPSDLPPPLRKLWMALRAVPL